MCSSSIHGWFSWEFLGSNRVFDRDTKLPNLCLVHGSEQSRPSSTPLSIFSARPSLNLRFAAMRSLVRAIARSAAAKRIYDHALMRYRKGNRNLELIELRLPQGLVTTCTTWRRDSKIVFDPEATRSTAKRTRAVACHYAMCTWEIGETHHASLILAGHCNRLLPCEYDVEDQATRLNPEDPLVADLSPVVRGL